MKSDLWRWADPDGQQRKVRLDELRAALAGGHIAPNTPVWRTGWQAWQPAHEVPELTSASLGGANGVVLNIPPPPLAMVAVQQEYEAASGSLSPEPPKSRREDEPPPPPAYVPTQGKPPSIFPAAAAPLKTQIGGSAHVPVPSTSTSVPVVSPATSAQSPGKLGPSLPTAIGLPPPPEVLAAAAAARPRSVAPPPLTAPAAPARPEAPGSAMIEELSGSMLLESSPAIAIGGGESIDGALPPPTDPILREVSEEAADDGADASPPRRPGLSLILDDIAAIRQGRPPKNKLLVGVLGAVALSVFIMLIAGVVSIASGSSSSTTPSASASAAAASKTSPPRTTTASAGTSPITIPPAPPTQPKTAVLGDCTTTGEATSIAPRAVVQSAIEAQALAGGLAIGFAPSAHEAVATSLDPSSLTPTATVRAKPAGGDARRVTPMLVSGKLVAMADVDRKGDRIGTRRVVSATTLIDVGFADGDIVWAPHGRDSLAKLFSLEGDAPVEALRAVPLVDRKGIALAFRHGNAVHVGAAKGDSVLEAEGPLSKISGLGQVGSPAITTSGDRVIAAWADRGDASDDWKIRWTKIKIGTSTEEATPFALPDGGLGGQAMSPSVASLGGGRFLLAWTEGVVSNHQVRAITIGESGSPSGPAIAISAPGVNAGQPAAVVGPDGRGAVAFLAAKGKTFEVYATPISCPPR